jgi:hypothetical protein
MSTQMPMRYPVGVSNYQELVTERYIYVDKTLMVREVFNDAKILIITRPRRFGKTNAMSMLQYFSAEEVDGKPTAHLFKNCLLAKRHPEFVAEHQGQYSVIFLTLKDVKADSFPLMMEMMTDVISMLYRQHDNLLTNAAIDSVDREHFERIRQKKINHSELKNSILFLSAFLKKVFKKPVIIIIDEYDTPILSAYHNDYFSECINFMRGLLGSALKDNPHVHKGVVTGITRIAKENLFSDLNNPKFYTILDDRYAEYFGFTDDEVKLLLEKTDHSEKAADIKKWYNGYTLGGTTIYNPWSIIYCLSENARFALYWVNTSDNLLVRKNVAGSNEYFKRELEKLMEGGTTTQAIQVHLTFENLTDNDTALWSLLVFSGYLTIDRAKLDHLGNYHCELRIPNQELLLLFRNQMVSWFYAKIGLEGYERWLRDLTQGNIEQFSDTLQNTLMDVASHFDTKGKQPERFYHGLILGLIASLKETHTIYSNRESGHGRYDIAIVPHDKSQLGIIIEFKSVKNINELAESAEKALAQIKTKLYANELKAGGIKKILQIGMAFCGKSVEIRSLFGK